MPFDLDCAARPMRIIVASLLAPRSTRIAIFCATLIATTYVLITFDIDFLLGVGPFWANPSGPWLQDPADTQINIDMIQVQIAYLGFLHADWHLPLFFVQNLGAPSGTNIIFMDAIPVVALLGKIIAGLTGVLINPYGIWVAACFILPAVFATLIVIETHQRSLLATAAASLLVITAPPLLHRFGHLPLQGHFVVIGALYLYLRDRRVRTLWANTGCWAGWLCLASLINMYIFAMAALIYGASLLRRRRAERLSSSVAAREPALVVAALVAVMLIAGHFGKGTGTSPFATGFPYYSMNLLSPFWPQRSGLFPGFDAIIDATRGEYEGFNYLGFGSILIVFAGVIMHWRHLRARLVAHRELAMVLVCLLLFALTHRVYLGNAKVLDLDYSWRFDRWLSVFRSSGRMFWPVFYATVLFGLVAVLRRFRTAAGVVFVLTCCLLQLVDTNPLRARLTALTQKERPRLLDQTEWQQRMAQAAQIQVYPTFQCRNTLDATPQIELQFAAASVNRPINDVYNARLHRTPEDCEAAATAARYGPWRDDTLYVILAVGPNGVPPDWTLARKSCQAFSLGVWCLGPPQHANATRMRGYE